MSLSVEEARMLVPNKKAFYEAMRRNQIIMPAYKEKIVSSAWMLGIIKNEYWCLSNSEVTNYLQCAKPPSRQVVARELVEKMRNVVAEAEKLPGIYATANLIEKNPPDVHWMLLCLSQMDPTNALFQKDYVPPKVDRAGLNAAVRVENLSEFFTGLPLCTDRHGKRFVNFLDKTVQKQLKMQRLQARVDKAMEALEKAKVRDAEREAERQQKAAQAQNMGNEEEKHVDQSSQQNPLASSSHPQSQQIMTGLENNLGAYQPLVNNMMGGQVNNLGAMQPPANNMMGPVNNSGVMQPPANIFQPPRSSFEPILPGLQAQESNTEPPVPQNNIFANATILRPANVIRNLEEVEHDLHSHQDFRESGVFREIELAGNRSVAPTSPKPMKKLQAHQLRQHNARMAKQMRAGENPFVAQGVESTRQLFKRTL